MVKDPPALGAYLEDSFVTLRRTEADVDAQLPPMAPPVVIEVPYDEGPLDSVDDLARRLAIRVQEGHFRERGQAAREFDMLMRHKTGVAKAPYVAAQVKMLIDAGRSVMLAGWSWNRV